MRSIFIAVSLIILPFYGSVRGFDYEEFIEKAADATQDIDILFYIAELMEYNGYNEEAALLYQQCVTIDPADQSSVFALAQIYRGNGLYRRAEEVLSAAPAEIVSTIDYPSLMGLIQYQSGRFETALPYYLQAIEYASNKTSLLTFLYSAAGKCYRDSGDTDNAITYFDRALNISTNFWTLYDYGKLYENTDEFDTALRFYQTAKERIAGTESWMETLIHRKIAGTYYRYAWRFHSDGDNRSAQIMLSSVTNMDTVGTDYYREKAEFWINRWR